MFFQKACLFFLQNFLYRKRLKEVREGLAKDAAALAKERFELQKKPRPAARQSLLGKNPGLLRRH